MNKDSSDKIIRNVLALSGSFVAFASLYLAYSLYFGFALTTVKFYSFRLYLFIFIFEYLFSTAFTGVNRSFIFRGIAVNMFFNFSFNFNTFLTTQFG